MKGCEVRGPTPEFIAGIEDLGLSTCFSGQGKFALLQVVSCGISRVDISKKLHIGN